MRFENGVGFSNGWAEFALKNPPPFVPSIFDRKLRRDRSLGDRLRINGLVFFYVLAVFIFYTFPSASFLSTWTTERSVNCAVSYGLKFWTTPCETKKTAARNEIGSRT